MSKSNKLLSEKVNLETISTTLHCFIIYITKYKMFYIVLLFITITISRLLHWTEYYGTGGLRGYIIRGCEDWYGSKYDTTARNNVDC